MHFHNRKCIFYVDFRAVYTAWLCIQEAVLSVSAGPAMTSPVEEQRAHLVAQGIPRLLHPRPYWPRAERMRGPAPTVTQGCEPSQRVSDSLLNASQLFSRKTPVVFTEKESGLGVGV